MESETTEPTLVLTIDAGGSGVKVNVLCTRAWTVLGSATAEYRSLHPRPGFVEFDHAAWWASIVQASAAAVGRAGADPARYLAVTCTAMRCPFVLLDREGVPVVPGVLNLDARGHAYLGAIRDALGDERLYALTGHWAANPLGLPKLLWYMHERPEVWKRVRHILQMHDWLLYELCGEMASEPSSASLGQLVDVSRRRWATDLLTALGLCLDLLPPLRDAGSYLGPLKPAVARALGLPAGLPVHVGGGDTHMACLGVGGVADGEVVIVNGSTTPIQLTVSTPLRDVTQRPWVSAHLWPGFWAVEMNAGATGMMYRWLRDLTTALQPAPTPSYEALDRLAAESPLGARDLLMTVPNPHWSERAWQRQPPGTLFGLTHGHTLGDLARATMESVCYAIRGNLEQLDMVHGHPMSEVTLTGGAGLSPLWSQMLCDVLGRTLKVPQVAQPAAVAGGRLLLNERGLGRVGETACTVYQPDAARHRAYQPYQERYLRVHHELGETFAKESTT